MRLAKKYKFRTQQKNMETFNLILNKNIDSLKPSLNTMCQLIKNLPDLIYKGKQKAAFSALSDFIMGLTWLSMTINAVENIWDINLKHVYSLSGKTYLDLKYALDDLLHEISKCIITKNRFGLIDLIYEKAIPLILEWKDFKDCIEKNSKKGGHNDLQQGSRI